MLGTFAVKLSVQVKGGANQGQMCKGLWEISEQFTTLVELFGEVPFWVNEIDPLELWVSVVP